MENLASFLLVLTLAATIALYFMSKKNFRKAVIIILIFYSVFHVLMFNWLYPALYKQNPMSKTIDMVKKYDKVVSYQIFHPSFTYYLRQRVPVFDNLDSLKSYLLTNKAAVISRKDFADNLRSIGLKEQASVHDLFEGSTTIIYSDPR